jgi:hypothetical protein
MAVETSYVRNRLDRDHDLESPKTGHDSDQLPSVHLLRYYDRLHPCVSASHHRHESNQATENDAVGPNRRSKGGYFVAALRFRGLRFVRRCVLTQGWAGFVDAARDILRILRPLTEDPCSWRSAEAQEFWSKNWMNPYACLMETWARRPCLWKIRNKSRLVTFSVGRFPIATGTTANSKFLLFTQTTWIRRLMDNSSS